MGIQQAVAHSKIDPALIGDVTVGTVLATGPTYEARGAMPKLAGISSSFLGKRNDDSLKWAETDKASNVSNVLWILQDEYAAPNFFE